LPPELFPLALCLQPELHRRPDAATVKIRETLGRIIRRHAAMKSVTFLIGAKALPENHTMRTECPIRVGIA
jgi:hypothetical protein